MAAARHLKSALSIVPSLSAPGRRWVETELRKLLLANEAGANMVRTALLGLTRSAPTVFLSHSHKDKPFVRALAKRLEGAGIRVWLDEAELHIGETLVERLSATVRETPLLIAVLSRASVKSAWVKEELHTAMTKQIRRKRVTVLPLLKERCVLPAFLEGKLFADFTTAYRREKNTPLLIKSIVHHAASRRT